ncbi:transposase [Micromonospora sagamiensis]|uniref:transposase n=1 Tax=Micromonospora sagamiensis TaxID=47875 RepID=UPI003CC817D3
MSLVGPGGFLAGITCTVLESALDAELDAHLDEVGVDEATVRRANIRNGHGAKTVQTEVGPCGSRCYGTGPVRSPRGSCRSTPAALTGSRRRSCRLHKRRDHRGDLRPQSPRAVGYALC